MGLVLPRRRVVYRRLLVISSDRCRVIFPRGWFIVVRRRIVFRLLRLIPVNEIAANQKLMADKIILSLQSREQTWLMRMFVLTLCLMMRGFESEEVAEARGFADFLTLTLPLLMATLERIVGIRLLNTFANLTPRVLWVRPAND